MNGVHPALTAEHEVGWTRERGTRSVRIYREVKVFMIGGGAEEIMKDLAAKQLGW